MTCLVLAAHGTRDPAGIAEIDAMAAAVGARLPDVAIGVGYVDVLEPTLAAVLSGVSADSLVIVVPLFLTAGYHVRVDVPAAVAAYPHRDVRVTPALGPDPALIGVAAAQLQAAGARPHDAVVLAAAGSAAPQAIAEAHAAGRLLGAPVGFIGSGIPLVASVVRVLRDRGARTVAVASWLLAPGLFHSRLTTVGADIVAPPLGAHPAVIDLIVRRYLAAARGATWLGAHTPCCAVTLSSERRVRPVHRQG
jgi:sirohydrochlorin ferrochelatase